jgi:NADP-dependent 3-hydroxy acid dehydrogenase YdfG
MVETSLLGAMTATEVFLDQLQDGGGDLVNVSSVAGRVARVTLNEILVRPTVQAM